MNSQLVSLNEAAQLVNKSTQTIRRLVKANKVKFRRKRTPQGFIYFIDSQSLTNLFFSPNNGLNPNLINVQPEIAEKFSNTDTSTTSTVQNNESSDKIRDFNIDSNLKNNFQDLIKKKDEIIGHYENQLRQYQNEKSLEIERNQQLSNQLRDQISTINRLSVVCELLQGRIQFYEQKYLTTSKRWWKFWRK